MQKILLSLLLILGSISVKAQYIDHITINARYFDPETLEFFTPATNGLYTVTSLDLDGYRHKLTTPPQPVKLKKHLRKLHKKIEDLIDMQTVQRGFEPDYVSLLKDLLFEYTPTDTTQYGYSVKFINPNYVLMRSAGKDLKGEKREYFYFKNSKTFVINNLFTLYYITGGSLIIINTGTDIKSISYNLITNINGTTRKVAHNQLTTVYRQEDLTPIFRQHLPSHTFDQNGKKGLIFSTDTLLPAVYDHVYTSSKGIVVTHRNKTIQLFYRNGDSIPITGIRATYDKWILKGNAIYSVDKNGKLIAPEEDQEIERFETDFERYGRRTVIKTANNWKVKYIEAPLKGQGSRYYYTEKPTYRDIKSADAYKAITFLNGSTICECPYNHEDYFIAETYDGLKGVLERDNRFNRDSYRQNYIEVLKPGAYNFTYNEKSVGLKFEKNGLYGYFPLQKEVRYMNLSEFNKGFARFTLPNGTQGWLALDGKEYLDE